MEVFVKYCIAFVLGLLVTLEMGHLGASFLDRVLVGGLIGILVGLYVPRND